MTALYRLIRWWRDRIALRQLLTRSRNLAYFNEIQRRRRIG